MRRALLTSAAVLALVLAACGAPAQEPEPTPGVDTTPTPAPTPEATPEVTPDAPDRTPPEDGAAADLVAMLPDEVDGLTLAKQGMDGADGLGDGDDDFLDFLDRLGRGPQDVSAAIAFGFDMDGRQLSIVAFRVEGADSDELRNEFRQVIEDDPEGEIELREETIDGRQVLVGEEEGEFGTALTYMYAVDDILFLIAAGDEDLAQAALAELP